MIRLYCYLKCIDQVIDLPVFRKENCFCIHDLSFNPVHLFGLDILCPGIADGSVGVKGYVLVIQ